MSPPPCKLRQDISPMRAWLNFKNGIDFIVSELHGKNKNFPKRTI